MEAVIQKNARNQIKSRRFPGGDLKPESSNYEAGLPNTGL